MVALKTKEERALFLEKFAEEVAKVMPDLKASLEIDDELFDAEVMLFSGLSQKRMLENKMGPTDNSSEGLKKQVQVLNSLVKELSGKVMPLVLFKMKVGTAVTAFTASEGEETDIEAFKKSFKSLVDEFSVAFRKQGKSEAADYIKTVGMALLGALVAIITSPMLLVSTGHGHWLKNTFFSGPETDKSKEVQEKLDDKLISSCLPTA